MCGFTAIIGTNEKISDSLKKMSYRGIPGHESFYSEGYIHIAHTRLPIVNLEAHQPAEYGPSKGFLVGEIFNFKELYPDADTDTLAATRMFYDEGLPGFHKFDGFWSFITIRKDKLYAVTDYLGQKPIYYRTDMLAVASEPEALLEYAPSEWDNTFFSNVMKWGYDPTGRTPWKHIRQLPPGHYWCNGKIQEYWNWDLIQSMSVREGLFKATANRLLGDRPVSCLLSGGLDSSIVFRICQELGADIQSFHIENGEEEYAKLIDPHTRSLKLHGLSYEGSLLQHQSPVDLGSVYPQAILAKAVRAEGYHVVLTGDGADELYGGYDRIHKYDSQGSDVFVEMPYYHLPKLDRLMMRNTIELRTPFLAPYVIKNALETPRLSRVKKEPLKKAFADFLPQEILQREKKALKILKNKTKDNIANFRSYHDKGNTYI